MTKKSNTPGNAWGEEGENAPALFDPEQYEEHKRPIAAMMGRYMLRHLLLLYREFEGDLLMPIVLGEIAYHNINKFYYVEGMCLKPRSGMPSGPERLTQQDSTNAFSISEATGIPRETVRRKIDKMVKKGWLTKGPKGEISINELAVDHFTNDFNKKLLIELLSTSACIADLLHAD